MEGHPGVLLFLPKFSFFKKLRGFYQKAAQVSLKSCAGFAQLHVRFWSIPAQVFPKSCAAF